MGCLFPRPQPPAAALPAKPLPSTLTAHRWPQVKGLKLLGHLLRRCRYHPSKWGDLKTACQAGVLWGPRGLVNRKGARAPTAARSPDPADAPPTCKGPASRLEDTV